MKTVTWSRILATTDFSPLANRAVDYAHALAEKFGAELHVLHVAADASRGLAEQGLSAILDPAEGEDERSEWLQRLLGESSTVRRVEAVQIGTDIADKIVHYARAKAIDLVVMATHGRTGVQHFWLGSIVERVLRSAPCPVLVLRPTPDELMAHATSLGREERTDSSTTGSEEGPEPGSVCHGTIVRSHWE
jgi:nucleotide-binding universal stress UspA family protein